MNLQKVQNLIGVTRNRGMTAQDAQELVRLHAQLTEPSDEPAKQDAEEAPEPALDTPDAENKNSAQDTLEQPEEKPTAEVKNDLETITKRWKDSQRYIQELKDQLKQKDSEINKLTHYASDEDVAKFEEDIGEYSPAIKELIRIGIVEGITAFKQDFLSEQEAKQKEQSAISEQHLTAKQLVAASHPDWEEIGGSDGFKKWMSTQTERVKNLAETSSDPYDIIMVIDLFKAQTGWSKKNKVETTRAKTVAVETKEAVPNTKGPEILDVESLKRELREAMSSGSKRHKLEEITAKLNKALSIKR